MHPSFDMSQKEDYFGNKLVTQYETFNYISKAFLVVFHCSAAINYAIIMKKNIIQANSKVFNSFWKGLMHIKKRLIASKLCSKIGVCKNIIRIQQMVL